MNRPSNTFTPKAATPNPAYRKPLALLACAVLIALGLVACEPTPSPSESTPSVPDTTAPEPMPSEPADTPPADDTTAPETGADTGTENAYPSPTPEPVDEGDVPPPEPIAPDAPSTMPEEPAPDDTPPEP